MTKRALAVLLLPLLLSACATAPPPRPGTVSSPLPGREPAPATRPASPASPIPGSPVGNTASGGTIRTTAPQPAVRDTTPSADAQAVLETIPEPLPAGERTSSPATSEPTPGSQETAANPDSADVPTPSPTDPLGDRPGGRPALPDTLATPMTPDPDRRPPAAGGAGPRPAALADSCWRVQFAAPPEPARAAALREAAQSQLLVPVVIEIEKGLQKVRTRDCLGAEAAERLKRRAVAAGFSGAFKFRNKPK